MFLELVAVLLCVTCSWTDWRERRIPNILTIPAVVLAFLLRLDSTVSVMDGLWGLVVGGLPMFVLYMMGGMGAGDVKLMSAIGALLGVSRAIEALLSTALIGGVVAVIIIIRREGMRGIVPAIRGVSGLLMYKLPIPSETATVPYGLCIAAGTLLTIGRAMIGGGVSAIAW